jgi:hypothetical protein
MATLFVDKIDPQSGTSLEIGSSGDTITTATGAKPSFLYPAFFAQLSANQTPTRGATTKIQINSELFDSNNCYDNSTNYRFTPTTAGKYYVYAMLDGDGAGTGTTLRVDLYLYKNGSEIAKSNVHVVDARPVNGIGRSLVVTVDMNGTSDYIELYGMVDTTSPNDARFMGSSTIVRTGFGAYRIGS